MLPPERPDRIHVAFDDHRLVANAGLLLPVTLAHRACLIRTQRDLARADMGAGLPGEIDSGVANEAGRRTSQQGSCWRLWAEHDFPPGGTGEPEIGCARCATESAGLKAVASKAHSAATLSIPRNRNLRIPCCSLTIPKTGSTICFLILRAD